MATPAIQILMLPNQCMFACIRWGEEDMMVRHMRATGEVLGTYKRPLKGPLSGMRAGEACYTHGRHDIFIQQTASLAGIAAQMLADQALGVAEPAPVAPAIH